MTPENKALVKELQARLNKLWLDMDHLARFFQKDGLQAQADCLRKAMAYLDVADSQLHDAKKGAA